MALQLQALEHRAADYLRLEVTVVSVQELIEKIQRQLSAHGITNKVHYQLRAQHEELECDPSRLTSLLVNNITALTSAVSEKTSSKKTAVYVVLDDAQLHYPLPSVQVGYVKKVAALRFSITQNEKRTLKQEV